MRPYLLLPRPRRASLSLCGLALLSLLAPALSQSQRNGTATECFPDMHGDGCPPTPSPTMAVCVVGNVAPFVSPNPNTDSQPLMETTIREEVLPLEEFMHSYRGHDVDMIVALASMKFSKHAVEVHVKATYPGALYAVRTGECDMGASAFTMTEYRGQCQQCPVPAHEEPLANEFACCLDFSEPYFTDGMTVLTRYGAKNTVRSLGGRFWSPPMVQAMGILVVFLIISGHLVWFFERKRNKLQFPDSYLDGVDNGIWWSFVTMTTVGYGDKVPITIPGRIIACVWMITGVLLFGVFNGAVVSVMQMPEDDVNLSGPYDRRLADMRICTSLGASGEFISSYDLVPSIYGHSLLECFEFLVEDRADSVFYDRLPMLEATDTRVKTTATSLLQRVSPGVEVGKSFQMAHFAVAMPSVNGRYNAEVKDGIARLVAGEVVFHPQRSMRFGFSMSDNRLRWTDFNEVLHETKHMQGEVPPSAWKTTYVWMSATVSITVLYILVQFGGLWIRRYRRYKNLKQTSHQDAPLSFSMVPLREDGSSRNAAENEVLAEKVLEQSGLKNALASIQRDMSMVRRVSALQETPPKRRLISTAVMQTFNRLESRISHSLDGVRHKNEARQDPPRFRHHNPHVPVRTPEKSNMSDVGGLIDEESPPNELSAMSPSSRGVKESAFVIPSARLSGDDCADGVPLSRGGHRTAAVESRRPGFLPPLGDTGRPMEVVKHAPPDDADDDITSSQQHPFGA